MNQQPAQPSEHIELRDAVRGPWRAAVIGVPVVAALLAGAIQLAGSEPTYRASGVVSVTEFSSSDQPAVVRSVVDDLDSTLQSNEVSDLVAATAPSSDGSIDATQLGDGGDVRVQLDGTARDELVEALDVGVREALTDISEIERRQIDRQLEAADAEVEASTARLEEIEALAGTADLEQEASRRSADILALRNQIASAVNDPALQASLESTLDDKEGELAAIQSELLDWIDERARFGSAVDARADASLALRRLEAAQADLRQDDLLQSTEVVEIGSRTDAVRVAIGAAVVALLVMVGLALLFGRRRGASADDVDSADQPTDGDDTGDSAEIAIAAANGLNGAAPKERTAVR